MLLLNASPVGGGLTRSHDRVSASLMACGERAGALMVGSSTRKPPAFEDGIRAMFSTIPAAAGLKQGRLERWRAGGYELTHGAGNKAAKQRCRGNTVARLVHHLERYQYRSLRLSRQVSNFRRLVRTHEQRRWRVFSVDH